MRPGFEPQEAEKVPFSLVNDGSGILPGGRGRDPKYRRHTAPLNMEMEPGLGSGSAAGLRGGSAEEEAAR